MRRFCSCGRPTLPNIDHRQPLMALLAVTGLALTGCGPETATTPPTSTPSVAVVTEADRAQCRVSMNRAELEWYATVTPKDLRRCAEVEGINRSELLYRVANSSFRDDENGSGARSVLATGADPDDAGRGTDTPLAFWSTDAWAWRSLPVWTRSDVVDEAVVRAFLEAGADPNAVLTKNRQGAAKSLLPLLRASMQTDLHRVPDRVAHDKFDHEWRVLHAAIATHKPTGTIKALLEHGADPNLTVARGQDWTALHVAAFMARADVIRLLLQHGADPHAVTSYQKWTAIHVITQGGTWQGTAESGHLLLDAGIDPTLKDRNGRTAWELIINRFTAEDLRSAPEEVHEVLSRLLAATAS